MRDASGQLAAREEPCRTRIVRVCRRRWEEETEEETETGDGDGGTARAEEQDEERQV